MVERATIREHIGPRPNPRPVVHWREWPRSGGGHVRFRPDHPGPRAQGSGFFGLCEKPWAADGTIVRARRGPLNEGKEKKARGSHGVSQVPVRLFMPSPLLLALVETLL